MITKTKPNAFSGAKKIREADAFAGRKLRERRLSLGWGQETLGDKVGLTFQQIQKYEKGANRISVSRLQQFADVLTVPVDYFFMPKTRNGDTKTVSIETFTSSKDGQAIIAAYQRMAPNLRHVAVEIIEQIDRASHA